MSSRLQAALNFKPRLPVRKFVWELDSKAALGFLILIAVFSMVGWLYLSQASQITATSFRIDELQRDFQAIQQQNVSLELEIARAESISRVEARARELGYAPAGEVRYISLAGVAVPQKQGEGEGADPGGGEVQESWWREIVNRLTVWLKSETPEG